MDPMLMLEIEECRKNELCESRVFNMWEGGHFFQMQAYDDPVKYVRSLWSFEVLVFGPSAETLSSKSVGNATVLQQTLAQTLVKKSIAVHKKSNLDSIELANNHIEKKVIPRVLLSLEKFSADGSIGYGKHFSLINVAITKFKGKFTKIGSSDFLDLVVFSFKDFK